MPSKPVVLCILDGWGHREVDTHNSIALASLPHWDHLCLTYPHTVLDASAERVGLPEGQMGNSEVGHMTIGSGQILMQDLPRINDAIKGGALGTLRPMLEFIASLKKTGGQCHLLGLLSNGGVHSHMDHLIAVAKILCSEGIKVWIHAFLDGRDTPPKSAYACVEVFEKELPSLAKIATLGGRYYGMDRDKRWDRIQKAFDTCVSGKGVRFSSALQAIEKAYLKDLSDEFIEPCVIGDYQGAEDNDGLFMTNFRADRARQILEALILKEFQGFDRGKLPQWSATLGMVEYAEHLNPYIPAVFEAQTIHDGLGEVLSRKGLRQLRIAETEKYAHVTFFFNGGNEDLFQGEERIMIPSPQVPTYDLKPEMSAFELTDRLVEEIEKDSFDFIVVNYANPDMVGHTGNIAASIKAVETVDACLKKLSEVIFRKGGVLFITADHGNVEEMVDSAGVPLTAHTMNLVPFLVVSQQHQSLTLKRLGSLSDIAPTILEIMDIEKPASMTGHSLIDAGLSSLTSSDAR